MIVTIEYPLVMKMQIASRLEVPTSITLIELKRKIFEDVWMQVVDPDIVKHGIPEEIVLLDKDIEVISDQSLRERLERTTNFQVIFRKHFK